ncbi:MAG: cache domain-containing protein, partial [Nitrospirales bacterium]|nr:cache domain-containing protein [Nitrospirales bacterium]
MKGTDGLLELFSPPVVRNKLLATDEDPMYTVMTKFLSWGIAAKLVVLFMIFGAIPMTAVGLIAYGAAEDSKDNIGSRFLSEAQTLADKIDRNLFERYGDVQAFGYNDAITRISEWYDPSELNLVSQVMNKYVIAYGIYDLAMLVDTKGDLIAVNFLNAKGIPINSKFMFKQNFSETPWFKALVAGQYTTKMPFTAPGNDVSSGTFIEDVHVDPMVKQALGNDGLVMGFSAPVFDVNGKVVAYWSNRTSFSVVEQMIQATFKNLKAQGFPGAEITLLDSVGRVIVDFDPSTSGTEDIVRNYDVLMKLDLVQKGVFMAKEVVLGEAGFSTELHARKNLMQVGGYY